MPLRVRCRCGQELVVRYSEWVYILLGLALLAILLNSAALIFVYLRLDAVGAARPAAVSSAAPAPEPAAPPAPAAPAPVENPQSGAGNGKKAPSGAASGTPRTAPPTSAQPEPEPEAVSPVPSPAPPSSPRVDESAAAAIDQSIREALGGNVSRALPVRAPAPAPLCDGVFLRWLFLERQGAQGDETAAAALLLDEDPYLQRRALDRLIAWAERAEAAPGGQPMQSMAAILSLSAPALFATGSGRKILARAGLPAEGAAAALPDNAELAGTILSRLRAEAEAHASGPALRELAALVRSAPDRAPDVALVIDISQSMVGPFDALQSEAVWLLPAVRWLFPGARVGAICFRDAVDRAVGLTLVPEAEVWRALQELRAEGGGDVAEGVHVALRAAFALGTMPWRDLADKHIVLVGDGSPPYRELPGLLSLLRQAHAQGSYRVHALGVSPEEGRAAVPMFPEIAAAGGGRSVTVTDWSRLGVEILLCLVPSSAEADVERVLPLLRDVFRGEG